MKKIIFVLLFCLMFLYSCEMKKCNNDLIEFTHSGVLTYYLDEVPNEMLSMIKLKVKSKNNEVVYSLTDENIKVDGFNFDNVGEYTGTVTFRNKKYTFRYNVEIRKWDGKIDTSWYKEDKDVFVITTANELAGLSELVNKGNSFENKTIELKYDIDLNNISWITIGTNGI